MSPSKHMATAPTVEGSVHPSNIDQQAYHCHGNGRVLILRQLFLQYLTSFTALCHGVNVDFSESVSFGIVGVLREHALLVSENELEKVILYVLPPQRHTILLLQMLNLVAGVYRRHTSIGIATCGLRC